MFNINICLRFGNWNLVFPKIFTKILGIGLYYNGSIHPWGGCDLGSIPSSPTSIRHSSQSTGGQQQTRVLNKKRLEKGVFCKPCERKVFL